MTGEVEPSRAGAWHQSKVSTILDCPRRFGLEYVLELPVKPQPWTVVGSAFHAALELHERARMTGEPVPSRSDCFFHAREFIYKYDTVFESHTLAAMLGEVDSALRQFWFYELEGGGSLHDYIMQFDPVYVESYFKTPLVPGSLPVAGWVDVVYRRVDGSFFIADFKTAKDFKYWNSTTEFINQAVFYAAGVAASDKFPEITELLPFEFYIVRKSSGKTKRFIGAKVVKCHPTVEDLDTMVERILSADAIVSDDTYPINPESKFCNERLCPFYKECQGARITFEEGDLWKAWDKVKEVTLITH